MTNLAAPQTRTATAWPAWLPALALALNAFAIVTVIFWIYRARHLFVSADPAYAARRPPTISRAIAEPAIGEPFAFWITLAGICLVAGVFVNGQYYLRFARDLAAVSAGTARVVRVSCVAVVSLQAAAGLGMHMLSVYRFPDATEMHMLGSYVFFVAQTLVVVTGLVFCRAVLRDAAALAWLRAEGVVSRRMVRLRLGFGWFVLATAAVYLGLFYGKDLELGAWARPVRYVYTLTEAFLITCFLGFLALFQTDLVRALRAAQRSA